MKKGLPLLGAALVAAGAGLLGWLTWSVSHPPRAPYAYVEVAEGGPADFPELALGDRPGLSLRKYEVRSEGVDQPLARRTSRSPPTAPRPPRLAQPSGGTAADHRRALADTIKLAEAIEKHAPPEAPVLAWWDTSRRLRLLCDCNLLLTEHAGQPILLPEAWRGRAEAAAAAERAFWGEPKGLPEAAALADALLSDEATGAEKLRRLVDGKEAFVVVDIGDAYKLGALHPDRFSIGFRDFPNGGDMHGTAKVVREWLKAEKHESYVVRPTEHNASRVYFLTEEGSTETLIAKLLPFPTSNPVQMTTLELVYQHEDYWVYRLPPGPPQS